MLVISLGKEFQKFILTVFCRRRQFATRVQRKGISLGLVPRLELSSVKLAVAVDSESRRSWLFLEEAKERGLLWRNVETFRLCLFVGVELQRLLMGAWNDGSSTLMVLLQEEVHGQFVLIDFDEVNPIFGLAEPVMIIWTTASRYSSLSLAQLSPRLILSNNKLIVIH